MKGTYYRWSAAMLEGRQVLEADILGSASSIVADPSTGLVTVDLPDTPLSADEARMYGVRLIEAAALADNGRSVRQ